MLANGRQRLQRDDVIQPHSLDQSDKYKIGTASKTCCECKIHNLTLLISRVPSGLRVNDYIIRWLGI